ncbi:MAG TPA: hypothetical protein VGB30_07665 [bacterium]|jgi:hypothetical protein
MKDSSSKSGTAWLWAVVINGVVFTLLWFVLQTYSGSIASADKNGIDIASNTTPGGGFGQITRIVGDESTYEGDNAVNIPAVENPSTSDQGSGPSGSSDPVWIDEFYLDLGPALSFSPRVNDDGSPRSHPSDQVYFKSPTYEDLGRYVDVSEINVPVMNPQFFSKRELPEEFRERNIGSMSVSIQIDARGRVVGVPRIVDGSGFPYVDQFVVNKLVDPKQVTFTPATRIDTREPVRSNIVWPIFWED